MIVKKQLSKILLIILLALIAIITFPNINIAATGDVSKGINSGLNIDWSQDMDNILGQVTEGDNYKIKNSIITTLNGNTYLNKEKEFGNTYTFKINNALSAIRNSGWLFCVQKGVDVGDGEFVIEKIRLVKNLERTEIRYAQPGYLYNASGSKINNSENTDEGPKKLDRGTKIGATNYYAKWKSYDKIYNDQHNRIYYKTTVTEDKISAARAYILSEPNDSTYTNYDDYKSKDKVQRALWKLDEPDKITLSNSEEAKKLLDSANQFAEYKAGTATTSLKWKVTSSDIKAVYKDNYVLIGPLNVQFHTKFGAFKNIKLEYEDDTYLENGEKGFAYCKSDGSNLSKVTSGENFYIKIPYTVINDKNIVKIKKIVATFSDLNVYAFYSYLIQAGTTDIQNQLIVNKAERKVVDKEIPIDWNKDMIPPVKIKLEKKSTLLDGDGKNKPLSGAEFTISYNDVVANIDKMEGSETQFYYEWNPTKMDDIQVTIHEKKTPYQHQTLNADISFTLKLNGGKWEATLNNSDDLDNAVSISKDGTILIGKIINQYISPIKIGGDIGGFNKIDQAGNLVAGAKFKATFEQNGELIATKEAISDEITGKLDFESVQPTIIDDVWVTIEEVEAPSGYLNSGYKRKIKFQYNKGEHVWEPKECYEWKNDDWNEMNLDDTSEVNVKYEIKRNSDGTMPTGGTTYVKIKNVENESKIDQLQLLKSNPQNKEKLVGAQFKITLENIKSYGGNSTDATSEDGKLVIYATTTNDGILLKDLVIKDVTNPIIITLEETLAPVGYKKIEGTITLTITRVGTKYTIVTSADETVVNGEFEADVVKIKPGDNGILKGDVNKNGILDAGDALLILKNSVGKYDFDEELKKIADVNGDNAVNSADAKWILDNKTPIPNSGSTIGLGGKGDVNGDGKITEADAEEILKYSVNLITEIDLEKADVDGNGVVNSADALRILKFIAGEKEGATGNVTEESNVITIRMSDIPIMNLGGIVWAEKDKVGKEITLSDKYDNSDDEEALGGITVKLVDIEKNKIVATTTTAGDEGKEIKYVNNEGKEIEVQLSKGQYLFTKLDDGTNYIPVGTGYRVEIDYDGIIYNALTNTEANILYTKNGKSKITLEEDYGLADGTKTISGTENESQSKTNGEYIIDYTLENSDGAKPDKAIYSKISTEKDGPQAFVTAKSEKYLKDVEDWRNTWTENGEINFNSYMFDVNFGLYTKMFDLALGTDVESATVSINGQTTKYDYDQILDKIGMGQETPYVEKGSKTTDEYEENGNEVEYNLYLTYSDYYYRISDYKVRSN